MIFQKTYQQVLDGTKTQTRRPVKAGEFHLGEAVRLVRNNTLKWVVGRTYAVQPGRGKPSLGRIRITKIRRERLQEATFSDVEAEGIEPLSDVDQITNWTWLSMEFATLWEFIYKKKPYRWEDNPEVWVLEFELVKGGEKDDLS